MNFHGVLYRGGAEQKIRQYLVDNNYVEAVIQLPSDLFFGTSIGTCIIVLKKNKVDNNILFIDASEEFVRTTNKNKLSEENINNILNIIKKRESIENKSILINFDEIKENDYNLTVNTYVKAEVAQTEIDIKELNERLYRIVEKENLLRKEIDEMVLRLEAEFNE